MSKYSTQLRWIVEINSTTGKTVLERCEEAAPHIFPAVYPFYDETKRMEFQTSFLRHFYMQEICAETVELWKLFLADWLDTNMPYWNARFIALNKEYDFLDTYEYREEGNSSGSESGNTTQKSVDHSTTNTTNEAHSMEKYYEVPSKNITSISDHLNNATETEGNSTASTEMNGDGTVDGTSNKTSESSNAVTRRGRAGQSPAALQAEYLAVMHNLQSEMWCAMDELFMQIW